MSAQDSTISSTLFGTSENDVMSGSESNDSLYGFGGNDTISGMSGDDYVVGYQNNDSLFGNDGNDTLGEWYHGEPGSDYLSGGAGNDVLYAYGRNTEGAEYDILLGGSGADKFVLGQETNSSLSGFAYYVGDGYATIQDFNWLEGDKFQAYGNINDYSVGTSNWSGSSTEDTGVYYQGDLIAVVEDKSGFNISLGLDFTFVT